MRITRVYTRAGDASRTRLVGGQEVAKDDPRIDAYGTVDELNAVCGLARTFNRTCAAEASAIERVESILDTVQNELFVVGSELATRPENRWESMPRIEPEHVQRLERWCDELNADLPPLEEFILPGGGAVGAHLHQARTVCRRAERCVVALVAIEPETDAACVRYLNRLSDLLFVLARWAAKATGEPEDQWRREPRDAGS